MIITALLNVVHFILDKLLIFSIPQLPETVQGYIDTLFDYIVAGTGIVANYTPLSYLLALFAIVLAVDVGLLLYKFVMWVIRKIPVISIS